MKKSCVIGWPITHSRSPLIHNYWLTLHNIEGSYERLAVEPQNLQTFIKNLTAHGYVGCNITLPHKEAAMPFIDHLDETAKAIGAINTLYTKESQTHATSTDGEGFYQNLLAHVPDFNAQDKNVTILGAGGSAKAIIERLMRADVKSISVVNRTPLRAEELQKTFGPKIFPISIEDLNFTLCDLLINTTSQGMIGQPELKIDIQQLPQETIVADIIYVPLKTAFLKAAESRGHRIVPGLGMLLHQAVRGFELWFDVKPKVTTELYELISRDIDLDQHK